MTPGEWTLLINAGSAGLTAVLVGLTTWMLQRAQTAKVRAETQQILREVRPNGGSSSHDKIMTQIKTVQQITEMQGNLLGTHIAESTADRRALHQAHRELQELLDARPWDSSDAVGGTD